MDKKVIYLDWNLYSILKEPKLEPHLILEEFIYKNASKITLVYSDAHLDDLAKTSTGKIEMRNKDLLYLSNKTNDTCIVNYFGIDDIVIDNRNALEFYLQNEKDNSDDFLTKVKDGIRLEANQYAPLRDGTLKTYFNLEPNQICNLTIMQLDELIRRTGISSSLNEFLKFGLTLRGSNANLNQCDYFVTAYTSLDLLNYYQDAMNEGENYNNLINDAKHSAYGSLCDAFITNDNKCFHKSKLLFEYYNSTSKLLKTCKIKDIESYKINLNKILEE